MAAKQDLSSPTVIDAKAEEVDPIEDRLSSFLGRVKENTVELLGHKEYTKQILWNNLLGRCSQLTMGGIVTDETLRDIMAIALAMRRKQNEKS